ncbi:alpha/beta fold hydrolase [Streptomyces sp. NPDC001941]|uniref:thioesterase II family protein n=1 Tax=Streptomyces sp. NPDC001941 TaxID=3154659 RepID=UPI00332947A9
MGAWTRTFHPVADGEETVRLVCFPHAGGAAGAYYDLSAALRGRAEVVAVQYPGRHDRFQEPTIPDVRALAAAAVDALPDGERFALFGHSMGSLVAFEAARLLRDRGRPPLVLFASGRQAPALPWPPRGVPHVSTLDDDALLDELVKLGGTDPALLEHPELLRVVLPALRADYRAVDDYAHRPAAPLPCPLVALTGDRDERAGAAAVGAWEAETEGPFELHVLPGGHFYLKEQLPALVRIIGDRLPDRTPPAAR